MLATLRWCGDSRTAPIYRALGPGRPRAERRPPHGIHVVGAVRTAARGQTTAVPARSPPRLGRAPPPPEVDTMSGPNTNYDPVEGAALGPKAVDEAVAEALTAAAAATGLDELKTARTAHQGDRSALALANREIGALPPSAKAEAGKRVGQARGKVAQAFTARQSELEVERDDRILVEERVDVTVPALRRHPGARHPIELTAQRLVDAF